MVIENHPSIACAACPIQKTWTYEVNGRQVEKKGRQDILGYEEVDPYLIWRIADVQKRVARRTRGGVW